MQARYLAPCPVPYGNRLLHTSTSAACCASHPWAREGSHPAGWSPVMRRQDAITTAPAAMTVAPPTKTLISDGEMGTVTNYLVCGHRFRLPGNWVIRDCPHFPVANPSYDRFGRAA